jgi:hypothetical protein
MTSLEFFIVGFLVGTIATLILCAMARKRDRIVPPTYSALTVQQGSATTNAPDELAKLGRETGAEIFDD